MNEKNSMQVSLLNAQGKREFVGDVSLNGKIKPKVHDCVEIRYLYGRKSAKGTRLVQPVYLGPRDDIAITECLLSQVGYRQDEGEE